jgi:hypothetical protein
MTRYFLFKIIYEELGVPCKKSHGLAPASVVCCRRWLILPQVCQSKEGKFAFHMSIDIHRREGYISIYLHQLFLPHEAHYLTLTTRPYLA